MSTELARWSDKRVNAVNPNAMGGLIRVGALVVIIGLAISLISAASFLRSQGDLLKTGVSAPATADIFSQQGLTEWGKRYIRFAFTEAGERRTAELQVNPAPSNCRPRARTA
jgi:hypothetical protein